MRKERSEYLVHWVINNFGLTILNSCFQFTKSLDWPYGFGVLELVLEQISRDLYGGEPQAMCCYDSNYANKCKDYDRSL